MTDTQSNVNLGANSSSEINVKRLGSQQKEILRFLYANRDRVYQQVKLIEELYGEVTNTRKASVSRSISKLREHDLVFERKEVLMGPSDSPLITEPYLSAHRPRYGITDDGETFLELDERFPDIEPN